MNDNAMIYNTKEILNDLKRKRERMSKQLESMGQYNCWKLKMSRNRTSRNDYYDVIRPGSEKKMYLGSDRNRDVLNIKKHRYLKETVKVLDADIELLENLIKGYVSPDYETINQRLPKTYQTKFSPDLAREGFNSLLPPEAIKWKQKMEAIKGKYPPYKAEQLKRRALDGTMMRSKSEVIIANILLQAGIPFVYEVPITINGKMILPDFMILSLIDLKTVIIIEHQGMIFEDSYAEKFVRSLRMYLASDWIPDQTVFFTFDNALETPDTRQLLSILQKHVLPSIDQEVIPVGSRRLRPS